MEPSNFDHQCTLCSFLPYNAVWIECPHFESLYQASTSLPGIGGGPYVLIRHNYRQLRQARLHRRWWEAVREAYGRALTLRAFIASGQIDACEVGPRLLSY